MNSPPKKHDSDTTPSPYKTAETNSIPPPSLPVPQRQVYQSPWIAKCNQNVDSRFADVNKQLTQQREQNLVFESRIHSLEQTTNTIDTKIDRLLDFFEDPTAPQKVPRVGGYHEGTATGSTSNHLYHNNNGTLSST